MMGCRVIVVDSSALLAVVLNEVQAERCARVLQAEYNILISAATSVETLIVAGRRGVGTAVIKLIDDLKLDVVTVTPDFARLCADAYARWGKGIHKASLNSDDCFAYALAKERDCALLFIGEDFSQTNIRRVL